MGRRAEGVTPPRLWGKRSTEVVALVAWVLRLIRLRILIGLARWLLKALRRG
jgi:hypothetical protein